MKSFATIAAVALTLLTACTQQRVKGEGTENLSETLKDFLSLIPPNDFDAIVNKHENDSQFAYVTGFVRTPEFEEVIEQLEDSAEWKNIVQYLADAADIDADILFNSISALIDSLLSLSAESEIKVGVDAEGEGERNVSAAGVVSSRYLQAFLSDVINVIPRLEFRQMVERKMQESEQFAKLYAAANHKNFRRLVIKSVLAPEVAEPLRILRRNGIDLVQQMKLLAKVISWGPRV